MSGNCSLVRKYWPGYRAGTRTSGSDNVTITMLQVRERRGSDVSDIFLSPEAYKATQAVEFIAEHLRNEDEYVQVNIIGNL